MACAALICKAAKKTLSKKLLTGPASYAVPPNNPNFNRISMGCIFGAKRGCSSFRKCTPSVEKFLMIDLFLQKRGQKHPGLLSENS
ncbi:MAG: hypothetical protein EGQ75_07055 [Clostridiales bacterium]|nr:hypothetical protein [Clostridiales bacterium]